MYKFTQRGTWWIPYLDGHVICYESRKLKVREKNYATHELELVA
jgi:hypothetical protein